MKTRIVILTAVLLIAALGIIVVVASRQQDPTNRKIAELEEKERRGARIRLVERVELAKAKGKTEIRLPGMSVLHPTVREPEEFYQLLPNYTVVIAELIEEKGFVGLNLPLDRQQPPSLVIAQRFDEHQFRFGDDK